MKTSAGQDEKMIRPSASPSMGLKRKFGRALFMLWGALSVMLPGQEVKRIYIANDDHTDYIWGTDEEAHRRAFLDMLDYYLNLADSTDRLPAEFQSRFNCDGTFWVWTYEKNKSQSEFNRLISRIKSGHISVPMTALNICYGGMPAEAVLRSLYYAGQLERRFGLRFRLALSQENQTLPYGLGALWAGAGAGYSWRGICGCASRVPDAWNREHDAYWWVGPDESKILMKWNSMLRNNYDIGGYAEARGIPDVIDFVDANPGFQSRFPYNVIGIFGYGGDDLKALTDKFPDVAQQMTTAKRKVIVSNGLDFFEDLEKNCGSSLASVSCSFGNEWDLLCASMAELSARVKRAVEKLRSAEALAALVSLQNPLFMRGREDARQKAWLDLGLYWEHCWTADGPASRTARAQWQRKIAGEIEAYVDTLYQEAAAALGRMIMRKGGPNIRFYVFNPLSWPRTDIADFSYNGPDQVHVADLSTGEEFSSQIVFKDGQKFLRILAEDVPSLGYKVYEVLPGPGPAGNGSPTVSGDTIENGFYKVTLANNGAITSLVDKSRSQRQMVREIDGLAMNDLGTGSGRLETENAGPISVTLRATAAAPLHHTTRLTLVRDSKRIEIQNEITQNFSDIRTWSFGFNLDGPEIWHEEVGAVIKAKLLDQGGHYASRAARYDWLTLNHFADISQGSIGMTLSNADGYFMRLGRSTTSYLDTRTPQISVLAGGQVDGPGLGIPAQGGDDYFLQRFALQTHDAFDPAAAMRFALEHQNPLVTGEVKGGTKYPGDLYSFLEVDDPDVLIWALKPAEETSENGVIARFWNLGSSPADLALRPSGYSLVEAKRTTHIETPLENANLENGLLKVSVGPRQWLTYYLRLRGTPSLIKPGPRERIRTKPEGTRLDSSAAIPRKL